MPKGKTAKAESLLVEFLVEELPPKSLKRLAVSFADAVNDYLKDRDFLDPESTFEYFATPRRLSVRVSHVRAKQPDGVVERKGPSLQTGLDASGQPTQALLGFARSCDVDPQKLERYKDGKGEYFLFRTKKQGEPLAKHLTVIILDALKRLPVAKLMRWGDNEGQFVRPVHGLVLLHGSKIIPGEVLRLKSGNKTLGHRFQSKGWITIKRATDYEQALDKQGKVLASFEKRRESIADQLAKRAATLKSSLGLEGDFSLLLDEVTALVEQPTVYVGEFEQEFLSVPEECLILTLRKNQKYFPLFDKAGKLTNKFLIVSNIRLDNPKNIVEGNERVVRPRLADARFFFETDKKTKLADRLPQLDTVVYHNLLGSQSQRVERVRALAKIIAEKIGADPKLTDDAARLAKADLVTNMVGEFPELQGIMGRYYALHDGEPTAVADAIGDQYKLRLDGADPENLVSVSLYLADRIEQMVGLFGVNERPTGEKDPFALRRAALGIVSVFRSLSASGQLTGRTVTDLKELLERAVGLFTTQRLATDTVDAAYEFIIERYRNYLVQFFSKDSIESVLSQRPPLGEVEPRIQAAEAFRKLPEAESLAAANKRIRNILRKSESASALLDVSLLLETPEKVLHQSLRDASPLVSKSMEGRDYAQAMRAMAALRDPVDRFFEKVLVNTEDIQLRDNRHALLRELDKLMNCVADISKLAVEK